MHPPRHRLLQRQIKRYLHGIQTFPPEWQQFLDVVNQAYHQSDEERSRIERTLELTSQELVAANTDLQQVLASVEQKVCDRTAQLRTANAELAETLAQLQQTQMQLVQAEKMSSLGQLVAGMAHELNNPVTFIHGNLPHITCYMQDLLWLIQNYQVAYPEPAASVQATIEAVDLSFIAEDLPKVIASITVGTGRIQKIVQALRTFSQLDEAEMKQVNIHECLESTIMLLNGRLQPSQGSMVEIHQDHSNLPLVECYAGQLNQVFLNVLTNAIDALHASPKFIGAMRQLPAFVEVEGGLTPADWTLLEGGSGPMIVLRTRVVGDRQLEVTIVDNADGIPMTIRDRLFDPFFTTRSVGTGTGLGLSTSYQIVTSLHQGSLSYRSTPGLGTAFVIRIPLCQAPAGLD